MEIKFLSIFSFFSIKSLIQSIACSSDAHSRNSNPHVTHCSRKNAAK